MSKVIKSSSVNIKSPKVIAHEDAELGAPIPIHQADGQTFDSYEGPNTGQTTEWEKPSKNKEDFETEQINLENVREQTAEILQETEQMVRELLETARQEAQKILKKANEDFEAMINSGHEQVRQIHEEAYSKGREEGYQEGLQIAEEDSRTKLLEAEKLVEKAWQERREIVDGSENEILQLAMAVARKVVSEEITLNSECVVGIVKKAVQKATDRQELTIRVNPDNLDLTLNAEEKILKFAPGIRKLRVTADPAVSTGGCVVETPNETVDARIERQLDEIEQALVEVSSND